MAATSDSPVKRQFFIFSTCSLIKEGCPESRHNLIDFAVVHDVTVKVSYLRGVEQNVRSSDAFLANQIDNDGHLVKPFSDRRRS